MKRLDIGVAQISNLAGPQLRLQPLADQELVLLPVAWSQLWSMLFPPARDQIIDRRSGAALMSLAHRIAPLVDQRFQTQRFLEGYELGLIPDEIDLELALVFSEARPVVVMEDENDGERGAATSHRLRLKLRPVVQDGRELKISTGESSAVSVNKNARQRLLYHDCLLCKEQ